MNLILSQGSAKLKLFEKPPVSGQTHAFVYENRKNEYLVIKNGDQATKSEIKLRNFHTVYRVSTGLEDFTIEKEYPSETEIDEVRVKFNITVKVVDPQRIVETQLNDPRLKVENDLDIYIKRLTRTYSINRLAGLEEDLNDLIHDRALKNKMAARGLELVEIATLVSSSEEKKQYLKDLNAIDQSTFYQKKEMESKETITEIDRAQKLKDADYVRDLYLEKGYGGAMVAFKDDERMLAILREVNEREQLREEEKERQNMEHQKEMERYAKERLGKGASIDEIKDEVEMIEIVRKGKLEAAVSEENTEKFITDEEKLKAKMKNFEESGR